MSNVEERLRAQGLELPKAPVPQYQYISAKRVADFVFVAGQGPSIDGMNKYVGQLGGEVTLAEGIEAAKLCALNCLACLKSIVDLDDVEDIAQVVGYVNSVAGFKQQPEVMDAASEVFIAAFGEQGKHPRAAVGTSVLPVPVEVLIVAKVKEGSQ
jgi:enamine deaminase RidA (YjgF/YER057c/UK114 family)